MKKTVLLLFVCFSMVSCADLFLDDDINYPDTGEPATYYEINVGNSSYGFGNNIVKTSLGEFREDQSATFKIQAQNFKISELDRNPDTGEIIYKYQPKEGYVGEDYVEILAPTDRNGNEIFETKTYTFQINVSR
ncbi:MAG: hypothetical protein R6V37_01940 [Psychroflexus maritimus]